MSFKIVGIGEVLWDVFPAGRQLGGAPANFAYHARALGATACVATRVGNDDLGRLIRARFENLGIADGTMQVDDTVATGTVTVALSDGGIPDYIIHENVAWDRLQVTPAALDAIRKADAICFGSLAQRGDISRHSIQRLVAAAPATTLRVFDINLRQKYFSRDIIEQSLHLASVLKLNHGELPVLAAMFDLSGSTRQQIEKLARKFSLQLVALTRGPEGSLLYQTGEWSDCPSVATNVVDTVGAGDSFAAAMVMGLLHKMALGKINALANELAGFVCSCAGATPPLPASICDRFAARPLITKPVSNLAGSLQP
ncbi:MAG TPA: carbohydrate kinase [Candidatus Dormibacteraeota bacterium]|nr:carbohydrate kinase [Candidatus Dormibacteraeota bacterium]